MVGHQVHEELEQLDKRYEKKKRIPFLLAGSLWDWAKSWWRKRHILLEVVGMLAVAGVIAAGTGLVDLQDRVSKVETAVQEIQRQISEINNSIVIITGLVEKFDNKVEQVESAIGSAQEAAESAVALALEAAQEALDARLLSESQYNALVERISADRITADAQLQRVVERIDGVGATLEALSTTLGGLTEQVADARTAADSARARAEEIRKGADAADKEIDAQITVLELQAEQADLKVIGLEDEIAAVGDEIVALEGRLPIVSSFPAQTVSGEAVVADWLAPVVASGTYSITVSVSVAGNLSQQSSATVTVGGRSPVVVDRNAFQFFGTSQTTADPGDRVVVRVNCPNTCAIEIISISLTQES